METLSKIEKELESKQERLNKIDYDMRENYSLPEADHWAPEATEIENKNKVLGIKRKHKLDRRNGLRAKIIWLVVGSFIGLFFTMISKYLINFFELNYI